MQQKIIFAIILCVINIGGQYVHLMAKADSLSKERALKGLPFSFRNDLIRKEFFAIQTAIILNIIFICIYCYATRHINIVDADGDITFQEWIVMFASLLLGYSGSSLGLKILAKGDSIANEKISNFDVPDLFPHSNNQKMSATNYEYVFTIPATSTGIKRDGAALTFDQYLSKYGGNMHDNELVLSAPEPATLEFILGDGKTQFVGHVPRPVGK